MTDPLHMLKSVFGFDSFRAKQEAVIQHVINGGDALVLMPTGGGKSLCYQIPAIIRPGVGVVISPLISLMQDQVDALLQLGVRAAYLNSAVSWSEANFIENQFLYGELDLLYVAPERLLTERFLALMRKASLSLFAIDETHCVSQWGHDFRPEYIQLSILHEQFPDIPRIALTATADQPTRREIIEKLGLRYAQIFSTGFDRPNICYRMELKKNSKNQLLGFLENEHPNDAGIVYCMTRKKVEETAKWLSENGRLALPYHAGLDSDIRQQNQKRFLQEEGVIVVATIAFGMGIDKSNVRFVAHLGLPKSLEAYYQETGRAGRDGLGANAWMLYGYQDVVILRQMITNSDANEQRKFVEQRKLNAMLGFCETTACRRQVLLGYFGETLKNACGHCDTCLNPVESWDGTVAAQKALSCVYRTDQRFGVHYLIDVLLGKKTERIQNFHHDQISTFGIGVDLSKEQWFSVYRQLIAMGFLTVDIDGYGSLQLTHACRAVLRGDQSLKFRKDPILVNKKTKRQTKVVSTHWKNFADQALWEDLRQCRLDLAHEQNVPPYIIFHDSTLEEIIRCKPGTLKELGKISGVGEAKLRRYGMAFLEILEEHLIYQLDDS
ncbi:MAG: DNA helicase RecQ [SAR324 cluster bacterium]|nr:DNA helicase RecQ [SAR324 cluster bacterium]